MNNWSMEETLDAIREITGNILEKNDLPDEIED